MTGDDIVKWALAVMLIGIVIWSIFNGLPLFREREIISHTVEESIDNGVFITTYGVEADTLWIPEGEQPHIKPIIEAYGEYGYFYQADYGIKRWFKEKVDSIQRLKVNIEQAEDREYERLAFPYKVKGGTSERLSCRKYGDISANAALLTLRNDTLPDTISFTVRHENQMERWILKKQYSRRKPDYQSKRVIITTHSNESDSQ